MTDKQIVSTESNGSVNLQTEKSCLLKKPSQQAVNYFSARNVLNKSQLTTLANLVSDSTSTNRLISGGSTYPIINYRINEGDVLIQNSGRKESYWVSKGAATDAATKAALGLENTRQKAPVIKPATPTNAVVVRDAVNSSLNIKTQDSWARVNTMKQLETDWNYTNITIHHSGNSGTNNPVTIERQHMEKGYDDVGYHYLIKRDGTIYEGRKLGYKSANVEKANTGKIGVLVMGDYHHQFWDIDDDLSKMQLKSTVNLINKLKDYFPLSTLGGHRDFKESTVCPGDTLYEEIDKLRLRTDLKNP